MRCWSWWTRLLASASFACVPAMVTATTDTTAPSLIRAPIEYPATAVSSREEGRVLVLAKIDADGRVAESSIATSSGHADLDAAALRSTSGWAFRPATQDGQPVARWVKLPVAFQLQAEGLAPLPGWAPFTIMGGVLSALGSLVWVVGFGWSVVLAKRRSRLWLSFMVAIWVVTYPLFVIRHWPAAKRNLVLVASGIALVVAGMYLAHLSPPGTGILDR